jgi:transcriptional regulator GlxA family with amidase domain
MQKIKVVFLILPQVHILDLAGPDQVFLEAIGFDAPFEISYCATESNIFTSSNLPFGVLQHFSEVTLESNDLLIIPGSNLSYILSDAFKSNCKLFEWIRLLHANDTQICSICSGAFVLAQSGILDGLKCTTHWKRTKELQEYYPQLKVLENILFVEDGNVLTSAGIASGIDLALHIIEKYKGAYFAHKVARECVIYGRRNGNHSQQNDIFQSRNHVHIGIHKVQDWLQLNLDKKSNLIDLASIANMSDRNFTRIFKKETALTVNEYITLLRKEKIDQLIHKPDISRNYIAQQCGLKSERHLIRLINGN